MNRDDERIRRNRQALKDAGLDALVCALPMNVLLFSGNWSLVGTSLAIFTRDGMVILLVPEDELELAETGWADEITTFSGGSLNELKSVVGKFDRTRFWQRVSARIRSRRRFSRD